MIFLSGKVSGIESEAKMIFKQHAKEFEREGSLVLNPMDLPDNHDKSWESYMKVCLSALINCDSIFMMKNWTESRGAEVERRLAIELGLKVIYE